MERSRELQTVVLRAVLLVGLLCLLVVPSSAAASSTTGQTGAHHHKTKVHRLCRRTRTHGRLHGKSSRHHSGRSARSHGCSGKAPTHKGHKHSHAREGSGADTPRHASQAPLNVSGENCQNTSLMPSEANIVSIREATLCLINRERSRAGEQPLRPDGALEDSAQGHSTSMAVHGYFEHVSPGGSTPLSRMQESGYLSSSTPGYMVGENIAWGSGTDATPAAIVAAWMASPPHRANILQGEFRDTGMGVSPHLPSSFAGGQAGAIYTEDFGVKIGS